MSLTDTALARTERALEEARAEVERLCDSMELAWGIIANAGGGDWDTQHPTWKQAAIRWRDERWHTSLERRAALSGSPVETRRALAERVREACAKHLLIAPRAGGELIHIDHSRLLALIANDLRALDLDALLGES